ncbi:MAG: hypothetical protein IJC83_01525 [Oscillospiraceae bacterium]|nr:hypothetical protein [Oscillospiraceae bacterium]
MAIKTTNRPGVFSKYSAYAISSNKTASKACAVVAKSSIGADGKVYELFSTSDALSAFLEDGDNFIINALCKILFAGGVSKIYAVSVDSENPDYETAFNLIKETKGIGAVVCDSFDVSVLLALDTSVKLASENGDERIAFAGGNFSDDFENVAKTLNSERFCVTAPCGILDEKTSGSFLAAALAGAVLTAEDAGTNFSGVSVLGLDGIYGAFSESRIDNLISSGVCVFENINSAPEIIKAVTTKTTENGALDYTYRSLNSILIIDDVLKSVRENLKVMLKNLKNNEVSIGTVRSLIAVLLQEKLNQNLISSFVSPKVYKSESEPDVLIAELEFDVTLNINQIHIIAKVNI